jgi:hypothetical protein
LMAILDLTTMQWVSDMVIGSNGYVDP